MQTAEKKVDFVSINTDYEEMKAIAKEFELTVGGIRKEDLVEQINRKIHQMRGNHNPKWYELANCLYKDGDKIEIISGILKDRLAVFNKPSAKKNAIKANLINPKTGELQSTNVTLDYDDIKLAEEVEEKEEVKKVM